VYSASLVVRLATDGTLALLTPASFPRLHAAYKVTEVSSCTTVSAYEDLLKSEFKVVSWRRCADSYRNSEEHDRQVAVEKAHVLLAALHDFWEQRFVFSRGPPQQNKGRLKARAKGSRRAALSTSSAWRASRFCHALLKAARHAGVAADCRGRGGRQRGLYSAAVTAAGALGPVASKHRHIALKNMRRILPDLGEHHIAEVAEAAAAAGNWRDAEGRGRAYLIISCGRVPQPTRRRR